MGSFLYFPLYNLILRTLEKETPCNSRPEGAEIISALEELIGETTA